ADVTLDLTGPGGCAQPGACLTDAIVRARAVAVALFVLGAPVGRDAAAPGAAVERAPNGAERAALHPRFMRGAAARDDVDHAADRIGPVERGSPAAQDFYALDRVERHGEV